MKRKSFAILLAVVLLLQVFLVSAVAAESPTFTFTLNYADKTVTVNGSGFAPNSFVSLMASYKDAPTFANLDYLNQLKADADGKIVNFVFKSKVTDPGVNNGPAGWQGGNKYFVSLNGVASEQVIKSTQLKINTASIISIKRGRTFDLKLISNGISYTYKCSNTSVATVDANGVITAVKAGMTPLIVSATDGSGLTAQIVVTVVA